MGCDIHLYKEKLVDGRWMTADEWVSEEYGDGESTTKLLYVPYEKRFTERNYQLFGLLSDGVRSSHPFSFEPRGVPNDVSPEVLDMIEHWDCDGHSHSYLGLQELKDMLVRLDHLTITINGMKHRDELKELKASIEAGNPNWDLLFPYCGGTNSTDFESFTMDVPASFYMGKALKKIIDGFDGVDGDDHRIVFFFDN